MIAWTDTRPLCIRVPGQYTKAVQHALTAPTRTRARDDRNRARRRGSASSRRVLAASCEMCGVRYMSDRRPCAPFTLWLCAVPVCRYTAGALSPRTEAGGGVTQERRSAVI